MLARILRAIDAQQTRPDAVVVVDNASTDDTPAGARPARRPSSTTPLHVAAAGPQHRRSGRLPRRAGGGARRRTPTCSGSWTTTASRRRTAWPRCSRTSGATTSSGPPSSPRTTSAGSASRSASRAPPGRARPRRRRARRRRRAARGRRHPVQRRAGHPRPRRRGSGCRARSSSSGATTWSTSGGPGGPVPGSPRSCGARFLHPATDDLGTPDDVRPHDVQPLAVGPQALLHGAQQRHQPAGVRRRARRAGVPGQDAVVLPRSPGRSRAGCGSASRRCRAARRRDFTGHERFLRSSVSRDRRRRRSSPSTAPTCCARCLRRAGRPGAPPGRRLRRRQRQHRPHRRGARPASPTCRCTSSPARTTSAERAASTAACGRRTTRGYDRIWLMDDDVVPAPGCLERAHGPPRAGADGGPRGPRGPAVREGRHRLRPAQPAGDPAEAARRSRSATGTRDGDAGRGADRERRVRGVHGPPRVVDAVGLPDPGFFIFYDDVDFAVRARRAGFPIVALRDAVLVRQLDFDQQHDMRSWKGYYMYRNLFVVHLRYGENVLVPPQAVPDRARRARCSRRCAAGAPRPATSSRRSGRPRPGQDPPAAPACGGGEPAVPTDRLTHAYDRPATDNLRGRHATATRSNSSERCLLER